MIGVMRSEWLKLRSVRSNVVVVLSIVFLSVGLGALLCGVIPTSGRDRGGEPSPLADPFDRLTFTLAGVQVAYLLFGVLGVQIIGQEYRFNTIRVTFAAVPRRFRVVGAKLVVLVAVTLVVAAFTIAVALGVASLILSARGVPVDFGIPEAGRFLVGSLILGLVYSVAGFGVGAILRQPIGAIVFVLVWPLLIENLLDGFLHSSVGRWLPYRGGQLLLSRVPDPELFSPWAGFAYFCGFAALVTVIGAALVNSRDA